MKILFCMKFTPKIKYLWNKNKSINLVYLFIQNMIYISFIHIICDLISQYIHFLNFFFIFKKIFKPRNTKNIQIALISSKSNLKSSIPSNKMFSLTKKLCITTRTYTKLHWILIVYSRMLWRIQKYCFKTLNVFSMTLQSDECCKLKNSFVFWSLCIVNKHNKMKKLIVFNVQTIPFLQMIFCVFIWH